MIWHIIGWIIMGGTLYIDLITDYKLWLKEVGVNHNRGALLRMIGLTLAAYVVGIHHSHHLIVSLAALFYMCAIYWLCFDGFYNNKRRFNWWYTGTNDPGDAKADNFLQRLTLTQIKVVKIGFTVISFILFILSLKFL